MPLNRDQQIFQQSTATQSWGNIKGQTLVVGQGSLRRGVNYQLGAQAVAQINILLNKWAELKILGSAEVSLLAQVQIQTPLDLFEEAGLAGRLQAVLKAAVAAGLSMNMTVGDLLEVLKAKPSGRGLSGELIELLLEESGIEGFLYAQFAVGFMAYANFVILGSLHKTPALEEAGFQFVYEAGMGFIAGGGYRGGVHLKFPDPGKLVSRYGGRLIDGIVNKAIGTQQEQALMLGAMLRIGVKSAYEASRQLNEGTGIDAEKLAQTVLTLIGGQFQSLFFSSAGLFFKEEVLRLIGLASLPAEQTSEVIQILRGFDAFESVPGNHAIFSRLDSLAAFIQNEQIQKDFVRNVSALWVSALFSPLAAQAAETATVPKFTALLSDQPTPAMQSLINTELNRPAETNLNQQDLLTFLLDKPLTVVLQHVDNIREITAILNPAVSGTAQEDAMKYLFDPSFLVPATGESFKSILGAINQAFDHYVDTEISARQTAISNTLAGEEEIRILFEQALIPCIQLASDVLIPAIIDGFEHFDKETMEEALSSVLLTMLGRSVIHIVGGIQTSINNQIGGLLRSAASQTASILGPLGAQEILKRPLEEAVKIIADMVAPLPPHVQEQLLGSALNIFTPIEGNAVDYANHLQRDPMWMPQLDEIEAIAKALLSHLTDQMINFALKIIPALFQALIDQLLAIIEHWLNELAKVLNAITGFLTKLIQDKLLNELINPVLKVAEQAADVLTFNIFDVIGAGKVKEEFFKGLRGAVEAVIQRVIIPVVVPVVKSIQFNPRKLVELCRNVSDFSFDKFDQIFNDYIFGEIQNQLEKGLNMKNFRLDFEVPVSFSIDLPWPLGSQSFSHTFQLSDVLFPSLTVLDTVMNLIRNNLKLGGTAENIYQVVAGILDNMRKIEQYQKDAAAALQKYSS
ncbi:hypothetical protein GCM10010912_66940 [Paenibacillus albidus]|uniref:Uncharacterized protein n=1 Tax=Paenibacillus albidus TaxID=2041023 RepID=A0A917D746_9BACL|nr:hypothetical protein [Paenibacillus albidus]GGG13108.1 hypothetical protein GCM10010912_66940 [Paenibacillus albidus]